jgi:hypothetical protein
MMRKSEQQKLARLLAGGRRPIQPPDRFPASQPRTAWATYRNGSAPDDPHSAAIPADDTARNRRERTNRNG